jgi:hypothetical protein
MIKDPMPFVAKFCPVQFGWENALMLNGMQWVLELKPYRTLWIHKAFPIFFSDLSGTVEDADVLSLQFAMNPHIFSDIIGGRTSVKCAVLLELRDVLPVHSYYSFGDAVTRLRADLRQRFSSSSFLKIEVPFCAAFSPVKYGWSNALRLNCLQWLYENGSKVGPIRFSRIIGTQSEAEWLSHYFHCRIGHMEFSDQLIGAELKVAFSYDYENDPDYLSVRQELFLLRTSLYSLPRCSAFLMARHSRLGVGSGLAVLGDDVCRMILALSME